MSRKIYSTTKGIISLSLGLVIPGEKEKVYVDFTGGKHEPTFTPSTLVVDDVNVQEALENTKQFKKKFVLTKAFKETKNAPIAASKATPEAVKPKVTSVPQIKNVQSAITHLIKKGADPNGLDTAEDVKCVGKEMGIEFPNLKSN